MQTSRCLPPIGKAGLAKSALCFQVFSTSPTSQTVLLIYQQGNPRTRFPWSANFKLPVEDPQHQVCGQPFPHSLHKKCEMTFFPPAPQRRENAVPDRRSRSGYRQNAGNRSGSTDDTENNAPESRIQPLSEWALAGPPGKSGRCGRMISGVCA